MQVVENEVETVHLYVVRDHEKKPYTVLPLLCALLCLLGIAAVTFYSAQHPYYEHERLTVPAVALPPKVFTAQAPIIPTGIKTYPATTARGVLTITNGSIISQTLPAGLILMANNGVSVVTDTVFFVPAGSANGYGEATVDAHAVASGKSGNLATLAINRVEGTSLYIRNLSAFTGGKDSRTVTFVTTQDKQAALLQARGLLLSKSTGLHYPCTEKVSGAMAITWRCQYVSYHVPSYMHVSTVQLTGKQLIISVWYLPPVRQVQFR
jgi:Baseplate J-like protein